MLDIWPLLSKFILFHFEILLLINQKYQRFDKFQEKLKDYNNFDDKIL